MQGRARPWLLCGALLCVAVTARADPGADFARAQDLWKAGDRAGALALWGPLAEQGHPGAQFRLGYAHEKGRGVPADPAAAEQWYRRAAEQGDADAQSQLGDLYHAGDWRGRIRQDLAASEHWHRKAAAQGNAQSQFRLGSILCWRGERVEGRAWLLAAERQGNGNAANERMRLCEAQLDAAGRAESDAMAAALPASP